MDKADWHLFTKLNWPLPSENINTGENNGYSVWPRLFFAQLNTLTRFNFKVERNETNGRLLGFYEAEAKEEGVAEKKLLYDDGQYIIADRCFNCAQFEK